MYENPYPPRRRLRFGFAPVAIITVLALLAGSILLTPGEAADDNIIGVVSEPDGAAPTITGGRGDCYGYFAVPKLLPERLGIPNIDVYKVKNSDSNNGSHNRDKALYPATPEEAL